MTQGEYQKAAQHPLDHVGNLIDLVAGLLAEGTISEEEYTGLPDAIEAARQQHTATSTPQAETAEPEEQEFGDGPRKYNVKLRRSTTHAEIAWVTVNAEDEDEAGEIAVEHEHEVEWETDDAMDDLYNADAEVDDVEEA